MVVKDLLGLLVLWVMLDLFVFGCARLFGLVFYLLLDLFC